MMHGLANPKKRDTNILVVEKEEKAFRHKIAFIMQQLEIWYHNNDLIVNSEKKNMCNMI